MTWSPAQYTQFETERTRPVHDLVARLGVPGARTAIDLGCGPGNSTEVLQAALPHARVAGVDSSSAMIESARKRLPLNDFEVADIADWARLTGLYDVVFANASLQWVHDHAALLPALFARVAPGGCLAVQTPDNLAEPAHLLMVEVAASGPWAAKLAGAAAARAPRHPAEWVYRTLTSCGAVVDMWRTTYFHRLPNGAEGIRDWFLSTGLRPFIQPLEPDEQAGYLRRYTERLADAYPALPDGSVLLPFPRLFYVASRPGPSNDAAATRASSNGSSVRQ